MSPPLTPQTPTFGPSSDETRATPFLWLGLVLALTPLCVRATTSVSLFPGWDMDPLVVGGIDTGMTPLGSMLSDVVSLFGAALLMLFARSAGVRASVPTLVLAAIGSVPVIAHALVLGDFGGDLGHARVGSAWIASIWVGVAIAHASADARARRVALGVLCGLGVLLTFRGATEWFIEHPRQVAAFHADKNRILASHGWTPGSSMALAFERRLSQPEASGWFGLSNVYASLAAALTVFALAMCAEWWSVRAKLQRSQGTVLAIFGVAVCGVAALVFSQSKGGIIAAMGGACGVSVLWLVRVMRVRAPSQVRKIVRVASLVGAAALIAPLGAIALRSLLGDRVGELSLLFRSLYAEAALRMFSRVPLWGVGPDGFQQAYALAKNPLSPEDPTSPHIVILDYLACLGVLGIAWVCVVLRAGIQSGRNGVESGTWTTEAASDAMSRGELRTLAAIPALATLVSTYLQGLAVTPELAALRVVGLIAWILAGVGIASAVRRGVSPALGLAGAALTLLAHAQIDVAATWLQSCGLVGVWIGLGACVSKIGTPSVRSAQVGEERIGALAVGAVATIAIAGVLTVPLLRVRTWEGHLNDARGALEPVVSLVNRLELQREGAEPGAAAPRETLNDLARDLSRLTGAPPAHNAAEFQQQMVMLETALIPSAVEGLMKADAADRSDFRARREASRLCVRLSDHLERMGRKQESREAIERAARVLAVDPARGASVAHPTAGECFALFLVLDRQAAQFAEPGLMAEAGRWLEKAISMDPANLDFAVARFKLAIRGNEPGAADWARRCDSVDKLMKYDRQVRGLSETDRAIVNRFLGAPSNP